MKLSIIIPCKNEEGNIVKLHDKITKTLKKIKFETIYIDDGSTDKTLDKLKKLYEKDNKRVKVLSFSRNFKKEAAMLAGLEHATGEYTCIIDADLQQNPKYLLQMYDYLEKNEDCDIVGMYMSNRIDESKILKICKNAFYKVMNRLSEVQLEDAASDFRMFRANVRNAILNLPEKNRFTKGIFAWIGFNAKYLPYDVEPRGSGKTSFGFKNYLKYAIDGLLAFSYKPLKISTYLGITTLFAFFVYLVILLIQIIWFDLVIKASYIIILLLLLLFGIQFILIGIVGRYIALVNDEAKNRPTYIIKTKLGFKE
ncbi:MAG: glycosyltransferase family 2 protein [Firmicutes bacterium]|nr:glycosyltransferase family 2 protein [Bacillota bacterium]